MFLRTVLRTIRAVRTMFSRKHEPGATIEGSEEETVIPVSEYRRLLEDEESTDEQIRERLTYLENFFRTIIRIELETYANKT